MSRLALLLANRAAWNAVSRSSRNVRGTSWCRISEPSFSCMKRNYEIRHRAKMPVLCDVALFELCLFGLLSCHGRRNIAGNELGRNPMRDTANFTVFGGVYPAEAHSREPIRRSSSAVGAAPL